MGKILGAQPSIGSDGVVTYDLPRAEPLDTTGATAAAAPDFGMVAQEINRVVAVMRGQGWDVGCLYNQETNEQPQLYFSHNFKTGDPIELAREVRRGLDLMNLKFM